MFGRGDLLVKRAISSSMLSFVPGIVIVIVAITASVVLVVVVRGVFARNSLLASRISLHV